MTLTLADIYSARHAISTTAVRTPLVPSTYMSRLTGRDFLLKLETVQPIGAFKLRGAANAVLSLPNGIAGVTSCSTGNHGRGIAYAARSRGLRAVICMSTLVPRPKVQAIEELGGEVRIVGHSQDDALAEARRLCDSEGLVEISPFDDLRVVAGQGTIGLELMEDRPDIETVLVPLSGGGLAGGVAAAIKAIRPQTRIVGVSMDRGAAMYASLAAGHPVEVVEVPSLADSLGGGIGLDNRLTFQLCRDLLDEVVLVGEADIYRAMQALYFEERLIAEGASAVGIAAVLADKVALPPGPVATIVTSRNVDMAQFTRIVSGLDVTLGDLTIEGRAYAA